MAHIDLPKESITPFCIQHQIKRLALFGSVRRDDFHSDSDIDIIVEFVPGKRVGMLHDADYICITDIARYKNADATDDLIRNWLRNRNTIEFLGIWEHLNNPGSKPVEFDGFRKLAGLNSFTLTPKQWIEKTNAIGLVSKAGRYGGTYAHT